MTKKMTNVRLYAPVHGNAHLSWEIEGDRFHYWTTSDDLIPDDNILYKNPPAHLTRHMQGHFNTRRLKIDKNKKMVEEARLYALANGLIEAARKSEEEELAARIAACAERDANARLIAAAPDMLAALKDVSQWLGVDLFAEHDVYHARCKKSLDAIRAAIAKAIGCSMTRTPHSELEWRGKARKDKGP